MASASPDRSRVRAVAPATVANFGPGFDVLGVALEGPGDEVEARRADAGVHLEVDAREAGPVPADPASNTAGIAAAAVLREARAGGGVRLRLVKRLPPMSGLGSSASSAVAAAVAVNHLLGEPLETPALLRCALEAEAAVSGPHADNAAAALLGGIVLVREMMDLHVTALPVPEGWWMAVATPAQSVPTREARERVPRSVPLESCVQNLGNLAALVCALHTADAALARTAFGDAVATPARLGLIPGGAQALDAAREAGALGAGISGSGPSLFAVADSRRAASDAAAAMVAAFGRHGVGVRTRVGRLGAPGARVW